MTSAELQRYIDQMKTFPPEERAALGLAHAQEVANPGNPAFTAVVDFLQRDPESLWVHEDIAAICREPDRLHTILATRNDTLKEQGEDVSPGPLISRDDAVLTQDELREQEAALRAETATVGDMSLDAAEGAATTPANPTTSQDKKKKRKPVRPGRGLVTKRGNGNGEDPLQPIHDLAERQIEAAPPATPPVAISPPNSNPEGEPMTEPEKPATTPQEPATEEPALDNTRAEEDATKGEAPATEAKDEATNASDDPQDNATAHVGAEEAVANATATQNPDEEVVRQPRKAQLPPGQASEPRRRINRGRYADRPQTFEAFRQVLAATFGLDNDQPDDVPIAYAPLDDPVVDRVIQRQVYRLRRIKVGGESDRYEHAFVDLEALEDLHTAHLGRQNDYEQLLTTKDAVEAQKAQLTRQVKELEAAKGRADTRIADLLQQLEKPSDEAKRLAGEVTRLTALQAKPEDTMELTILRKQFPGGVVDAVQQRDQALAGKKTAEERAKQLAEDLDVARKAVDSLTERNKELHKQLSHTPPQEESMPQPKERPVTTPPPRIIHPEEVVVVDDGPQRSREPEASAKPVAAPVAAPPSPPQRHPLSWQTASLAAALVAALTICVFLMLNRGKDSSSHDNGEEPPTVNTEPAYKPRYYTP